jgi:radical SAM protein with 4Fe4S-binding SPASM domain
VFSVKVTGLPEHTSAGLTVTYGNWALQMLITVSDRNKLLIFTRLNFARILCTKLFRDRNIADLTRSFSISHLIIFLWGMLQSITTNFALQNVNGLKFTDTLNFLSKLKARKVYNAASVTASFYLSRLTRKPVQWGMPLNVSVEPTTSCNLHCPECPSGLKSFTRPTGSMQNAFYKNTIDEIGDNLIYLYFYFQGEPYLNPQFLAMVKLAADKGIYTVTSTNAHFLTERKARETVESGLDRILISIDGATQKTYEQYRIGGQLDKVIEGTKNLVRAKKGMKSQTPHIIFQFLVVKPNEHEIDAVKKLGQELGVDEVKFKTAQVYDYEHGNELIPTIDKYARYAKQKNGTYRIKNELLNHCWKLWHSCVITWDGRVVPCCFDKDAKHQLGDLSNTSFSEIWRGDLYNSFRTNILHSRSEIDICTNCSEGTRVWAS